MVIPFDTMKVIQASAVLLRQHAGRTSRLRLLKLLYIADRESLAQTLRPITGDRAVAVGHGPALARTGDLMKREHLHSPVWDQYIAADGPQEHRLAAEPGNGKLSRSEIERLTAVGERYRQFDDYDLAVHSQSFEEWVRNRPPPGGSRPITLDDLLAALDLTPHKARIEADARADEDLDRLLASVGHG